MTQAILSQKRVLEMVPYSGTHLARLEKAGQFPKRVKLGAHRVGWIEAEVEAWISERAEARFEPPASPRGR